METTLDRPSGRGRAMNRAGLDLVILRVVQHQLAPAGRRVQAKETQRARAVGRPPRDQDPAVGQGSGRVEAAVTGRGDRAIRMQRPAERDAGQGPRAVAGRPVGLDEDDQIRSWSRRASL